MTVSFVFLGLQLIFRFIDESGSSAGEYALFDAIVVSVSALPYRFYLDLPFVVLIAVAVCMGVLAQNSELTVLRAAGLSRRVIFSQLIVIMLPILGLSLVAGQFGVIDAERFSRAYEFEKKGKLLERVWVRDQGKFVRIQGAVDGTVEEVLFVESTGLEINSLTWGFDAAFSPGTAVTYNQTTQSFSQGQIETSTGARQFETGLDTGARWLFLEPDVLSISELMQSVRFFDSELLDSTENRVLLYQRLSLPLTLLVLAALGFITSFGVQRSITVSQRVLTAIILGILFKYCAEFTTPLALILDVPPFLAVALPLTFAVILALPALRWSR